MTGRYNLKLDNVSSGYIKMYFSVTVFIQRDYASRETRKIKAMSIAQFFMSIKSNCHFI